MSQSTTQKEILNTQLNAQDNHNKKSTSLIERKQIEGTPFTLIKQSTDDSGKDQYFIVMGDYRLTTPTETEQQTLEKLITEHWLIIANIVALTVDVFHKIKKDTIVGPITGQYDIKLEEFQVPERQYKEHDRMTRGGL